MSVSGGLGRDQQWETQWKFTSLLLDLYGSSRNREELTKVSKRLVSAGVSETVLHDAITALDDMSPEDKLVWDKMNARGFSVEQMLLFAEAPVVAKSLGQRERVDVAKDIAREWKSLKETTFQAASDRAPAFGSLVVLAGVVSCATIQAYGAGVSSKDIQETAQILSLGFPHAIQEVLDFATRSMSVQSIAGAGALVLGAA